MSPLVCCGLTTLDVAQVVEHLPAADEKVTARGLTVDFGGPAANAAAAAVALGVPTTLVTAIGDGPLGRVVRARLEEAGVRVVDLLAHESVDPPVSTVLVTAATGERAVVSVNDTARRAIPPAPQEVLDGAATLLLDGWLHDVAVRLARAAQDRGVGVALDGGSFKPGTDELLAQCDVAIVSADFHLPGPGAASSGGAFSPTTAPRPGSVEDLAAISALGPGFVARSAGAGPIAALLEGGVVDIEVPAAGRVVDTLGAGDVLHGAFAAAWSRWPREELAALGLAARVATASVAYAGARGWVADDDVRKAFAAEIAGSPSVL